VSQFYETVFDWKIQHIPELNYRVVETGGEGGINGGIVQPPRPEPWPGNMTLYIAVDHLADYRKRIAKAGGKIHVEEQEVPGMGAFTLFTDPEGRMMGLWKAKRR
jgi:predicted enzyme related to lactoylglutathione lyase